MALAAEAAEGSGIEWTTMAVAADRYGVHVNTIRSWISEGTIEARRFRPKLIRVDAASIEPIVWAGLRPS